MSSSNLPPGVTEGMIPGNRPEDMEDAAFWDAFDEELRDKPSLLPQDWQNDDRLCEAIMIARELGRKLGFEEGREEERMDQAALEEQRHVDPWNDPPLRRLDAIHALSSELVDRIGAHRHMAKLEERAKEESHGTSD